MKILHRLKSLFSDRPVEAKADPSPGIAAGKADSQSAIDPQAALNPYFIGRNRYQRYEQFRKAFEELGIVHMAIESLVLLSNGSLQACSGDSEVDEFTIELLDRLNFSKILEQSFRSWYVVGNSLDEIVYSVDFRNIIKVFNVDTSTLYIAKDKHGNITDFLQLPLNAFGALATKDTRLFNRLPRERMMFDARAELGSNVYGVSILQAPMQSGLFRTLQIIERSKGEIYHRLAGNAMHWNYAPQPGQRIQQKEAENVMNKLKAAVAKRKLTDDVYTAGPITAHPLFQYSGIDLSKDQQFVIEQIAASLQIVPELFGFSFGQAQSQTREKLAVMIDRIARIRKSREFIINTVLMPQVEATYRLSVRPRVRFEHARIVDAKLDAEKFAIWITYVQQILKMGFVDFGQAARMLELPGLFDVGLAEKWLERNTEMPTETKPTNETQPENKKDNQITQTEDISK